VPVLHESVRRWILNSSEQRFQGVYDAAPWDGEMIVFPWEDGLALVELPTSEPRTRLVRLRPVAGKEAGFRTLRQDGSLGDPVDFEMDAQGRVIAAWRFSNPWPKVELPAR
jgi:hypothetical protein